jgi:fructose-1,6-bisphosphatase/sedoheptulose 1,7-bisphosphatase-like protein
VGASLLAKAADPSTHTWQAEPTMHTTIIITFGLILLALMLYIGEKIGFSRQTLAYGFIVLWLALTLINGAVGMVHAGQPLSTELVVGSAVFGIPAAALVLFMVLTTET